MTAPHGPLTGRPPARAMDGMVATPHALASGTGLQVLRNGGSAVDAAIAANAVLCVAYPHMAGLGGDAFAIISQGGQVSAINASGPAAAGATREFYESRGHTEEIPDRGPLSALTVPGAVDGWRLAHEAYGRLDWADLFTDAIALARTGVVVGRSLAQWLAADAMELAQDEGASAIYLPGGDVAREGAVLVNHDLAQALQLVAERGPRAGFYDGELAERLCAGDSPLEPSDLSEYRAEWVSTISTQYRGYTVHELGPNTQGFTALQALNILAGHDVAGWGDMSVPYVHHAAEAIKLAFADRDAWLTDPEHHDIPLEELISPDYAAERRGLIEATSAMTMADVSSGIPGGWTGPSPEPAGDTVYLCATDSTGLTVSLIESIYHDFGSTFVPPGSGVLLQNRGSFFELDPEHHNRLEPGKRTFHTLIPALAQHPEREETIALGAMGGEGQPQSHVAMLTRMIDFGYDVQQAIEAPRWLMGRTWGAESQDLWLEGRFPDPLVHELARYGQPVQMMPDWDDNVGHAQVIRTRPEGYFEGGADPRGDGAALGY